jgi:hypothetical protein
MAKAPVNELGTQGNLKSSWRPQGGSVFEVDPTEQTPELMWPQSVMVYDAMRRTDGQIAGLIRACTLPILSAQWDLDIEGVRPEVANLVRTEIGLNAVGKSRRRRRREGINWLDHLRLALLALPYGHMPFEQVYQVGAPNPDQANIGLDEVVHLRKLSPRMPRTLTEIRVDRDGGLAGISQAPLVLAPGQYKDVFIPVDRLVFYTIDREGADWTGNSMLRPAYKHWFIKDMLLRISAQVVERNGMGVPVMSFDENTPGAHREDAERAVADFRSGATAGLVKPMGTTFELVGVSGSTADPLPVINYHDQAITKSSLAMFMDLGHDAGARSLGDTFVDFFTASLQAVAEAIAETATEHIIRDLVEWNYGPDEPYPVLTPGDLSQNNTVTSTVLGSLVSAGLITPDGKLETHLRKQFNLPDHDAATARPQGAAAAPAGAPGKDGTVLPLSEGVDPLDRMAVLAERLMELKRTPGHGS